MAHIRPAAPATRIRTSTSEIGFMVGKVDRSIIQCGLCIVLMAYDCFFQYADGKDVASIPRIRPKDRSISQFHQIETRRWRRMKINTEDFRIRPGVKVNLKKRPTSGKPICDSKEDYKKLLEKH